VSANFRGENAAASLKQGDGRDCCCCFLHIRDIRAAASLKLEAHIDLGERIAPIIRGIRAAASLKLEAVPKRPNVEQPLPRHSCRGLIEAFHRTGCR